MMDLQADGYGTTEIDDADDELNNYTSELSVKKAKCGTVSSLIDDSASADLVELTGVKRPRECNDPVTVDSDDGALDAGNKSSQMGEATKPESQISYSSDSDSDDSDADISVISR